MPITNFVTLVNANVQMSNQIMNMLTNIANMENSSLYIDRMKTLLSFTEIDKNAVNNTPATFRNNINIKNVCYSYGNSDKLVLRNITFTINKGDKIALVGRNGSGKSTLLKLLLHLYEPDSGDIYMDELNIKNIPVSAYLNTYSVMMQSVKYYPFSIKQFLLRKDSCDKSEEQKIWEALKFSGLYDKIAALPNGLDSILSKEFNDDGIVLSGGELQRLCLSRTYLHDGEIILIDEPSSALDPISEIEIFEKIFEHWKEKTIIYISHNLSSVKYSSKVIFLHEGSIYASGKHNDLIRDCPLYAQMYELQKNFYD